MSGPKDEYLNVRVSEEIRARIDELVKKGQY